MAYVLSVVLAACAVYQTVLGCRVSPPPPYLCDCTHVWIFLVEKFRGNGAESNGDFMMSSFCKAKFLDARSGDVIIVLMEKQLK